MAENPNDIAAKFCSDNPGWEPVLDDDGDVIFITSPFYDFRREEESDEGASSDEQA